MVKEVGSPVMAKEELPECPVATAVALIGGKWKLLIIRNLRVRPGVSTSCAATLRESLRRCLPTACGRWRMMGWSFATTMARILPVLSMALPSSAAR